ncbi:MAG: FABP family protein [Halieaceae bacterium]|jgi:methylamine---glutamate N-methyltransferase subunit C|nr:FABP family protein [Halieaceae bacterium]
MIDGIDYGPLEVLVGQWQGDKGTDISPEPDGQEDTPYFETIDFEAAGDVTNGGKQTLAIVRYHQVVSKKAGGQVFHDEIGYWTWDSSTDVIAHSLTIPRAVCVLAGGVCAPVEGAVTLNVEAREGDKDWGIIQSPFMRDNAKTIAFKHRITVDGDNLDYFETMVLDIYGKIFDHTDSNSLTRVS